VIQRDPTRGEVAPVLVRSERNPVVTSQSLERLFLDQRHLAVDVMLVGIGSTAGGVAVALEAYAFEEAGLFTREHRCRSFPGDVEVDQFSGPMHSNSRTPR
jgi:hypothetical protein